VSVPGAARGGGPTDGLLAEDVAGAGADPAPAVERGPLGARGAGSAGVVLAGDAPWPAAPRGWHLAVLAGTLPPLLLGAAASVLANRIVFLGWAAAAALGHTLLLRAAWGRGWSAAARAALCLGWAGTALAGFGSLAGRHGEILDLGYRAMLWVVYTPAFVRPLTYHLTSVALLVAALVAAALARRQEGRAAS
jgi:hypothetical protein